MNPISQDDLQARITQNIDLLRLTRDPLLQSAVRMLTDALADAVAHDEDPVPLSQQTRVALGMVEAMQDAHLTLFGFSPRKGA